MARTMRFRPINPPFEEGEETSGAKLQTTALFCFKNYNGAMLRCTINRGKSWRRGLRRPQRL